MKTTILLIAFIASSFFHVAIAKNNPSKINGSVYENVNGVNQPVALAFVYIENTAHCTYTNEDGSFSIAIPEGKHTVKVSFKGYNTEVKKVDVKKNNALSIKLTPESLEVAEK